MFMTLNLTNTHITPYKNGIITLTPWVGSKELQTINILLAEILHEPLGVTKTAPRRNHIQIHTNTTNTQQFIRTLHEQLTALTDDELYTKFHELKRATKTYWEFNKYDPYISESLLKTGFIHDHLTIPEAKKTLLTLTQPQPAQK